MVFVVVPASVIEPVASTLSTSPLTKSPAVIVTSGLVRAVPSNSLEAVSLFNVTGRFVTVNFASLETSIFLKLFVTS